MEPLRRYEAPEPPHEPQIIQSQPIAQSSPIRQTPPNTVTYAQIIRPTPQYINVSIPQENLDFRLQTPPPVPQMNQLRVITSNDGSQGESGRSSISSGYIDLTSNQGSVRAGAIPKNPNQRPTSPETSF